LRIDKKQGNMKHYTLGITARLRFRAYRGMASIEYNSSEGLFSCSYPEAFTCKAELFIVCK
jgi:hypothetical protein